MVFKRYVEIGRVALINRGPHTGKLCVIVDVIDATRALVDGPESEVPRHACAFKALALTDIKVKLAHSAKSASVSKAFKAEKVADKWAQTAWAKKLALQKKRMSLNDFDRFVVKINKQKKAKLVNTEFNKLKKSSK